MNLQSLVSLAALAAVSHQAGDTAAAARLLDNLYASIDEAKRSAMARAVASVQDDAADPTYSDEYVAPTLAEILEAGMVTEPEAVVGLAPVGALLDAGAQPVSGTVAIASANQPSSAANLRRHLAQVTRENRSRLQAAALDLVG